MRKTLFPNAEKPTMAGALARIGDDAGLTEAGGDTMLSSPSDKDGPMTDLDLGFGGSKAAPFVKGGGRSKSHPNDAKGKKRAAIKKALKTKDYSVEADAIDLGRTSFDPSEPRGTNGRWVRAAMKAAKAGDLKALKHLQEGVGVDYEANPSSAMYRERNDVLGIRADVMEALRLTDKASQHAIEKRLGKRSKASKIKQALRKRAAEHRANSERPISKGPHGPLLGDTSYSNEGADDVDLGLFHHDVSKEARDAEGKWRSIQQPGKRQGEFLKARNDLAKAQLEGNPRKIKRAKTEVGKAKWKWDQEQNGKAAADRAAHYYAEQATARVLAANHTRQEGSAPPKAGQTPGTTQTHQTLDVTSADFQQKVFDRALRLRQEANGPASTRVGRAFRA